MTRDPARAPSTMGMQIGVGMGHDVRPRTPWSRATWVGALAWLVLLGGCSSLPFMHRAPAASAPDAAASAPQRALYRLEVVVPDGELRTLLADLDLTRFQTTPVTDTVTPAELQRLMNAAPTQVRGLLETAGYFNSDTRVELIGNLALTGGAPAALPVVRVEVTPGPRTVVVGYDVRVEGPLASAASAASNIGRGEQAAAGALARSLRNDWPLKPPQPFRETAWTAAKAATLVQLRNRGYPSATWKRTAADVDAEKNAATLDLLADSGPLYRLGPVRVEGAVSYGERSVQRLATFGPGTPYDESLLQDYQQRLLKIGLFENASVEIDAAPETAAAAPVLVRVKEAPLQQATVGVGFSANTGPRVSLEHTHRQPFGIPWVAQNKLLYGPSEKSWNGTLTSYPLDDLYRHVVGGMVEQLRTADEVRNAWSLRGGRTQETPRIDRTQYLELAHAKVDSNGTVTDGNAVSGNAGYIWRDVDNVLLPTRGVTVSAQGALGYGRGTETYNDALGVSETDRGQGPFVRAYARTTWYKPLPADFFGTFRFEAGEVFARSQIGVPDTLLFRAGGDNSVRGYGYRTLGPIRHNALGSGRVLATASLEAAHPFIASLPAYLWAVFVDVGNAADRWQTLNPALGVGAGVRWRSPVGPLKLDVAYGERVHAFRLHLTVGVTF